MITKSVIHISHQEATITAEIYIIKLKKIFKASENWFNAGNRETL
jgi:hypothetical protein